MPSIGEKLRTHGIGLQENTSSSGGFTVSLNLGMDFLGTTDDESADERAEEFRQIGSAITELLAAIWRGPAAVSAVLAREFGTQPPEVVVSEYVTGEGDEQHMMEVNPNYVEELAGTDLA